MKFLNKMGIWQKEKKDKIVKYYKDKIKDLKDNNA